MSVHVALRRLRCVPRGRRPEGFLRCAWTLAAVASALACSERAAPTARAAEAWPAGTVMVLNGVPIGAEEVDRIGGSYAQLEPQDTPTQLRRLALSRTIFPLIAARGIDPARREAAQEQAREYRESLLAGALPSGPLSGPMEETRAGHFLELGFATWNAVLDAPLETWSEVIETPGSFHVVRVKKRAEGALPSLTLFTIGAFDFPYLDFERATAEIESALDRSRLTIVDDTWRDAVPAAWRYRFHAESP